MVVYRVGFTNLATFNMHRPAQAHKVCGHCFLSSCLRDVLSSRQDSLYTHWLKQVKPTPKTGVGLHLCGFFELYLSRLELRQS